MNTKDINRLIEQDAKLKGDVFGEKIQKLVLRGIEIGRRNY